MQTAQWDIVADTATIPWIANVCMLVEESPSQLAKRSASPTARGQDIFKVIGEKVAKVLGYVRAATAKTWL